MSGTQNDHCEVCGGHPDEPCPGGCPDTSEDPCRYHIACQELRAENERLREELNLLREAQSAAKQPFQAKTRVHWVKELREWISPSLQACLDAVKQPGINSLLEAAEWLVDQDLAHLSARDNFQYLRDRSPKQLQDYSDSMIKDQL